jgi:hypothetical protein
LEVEPPDASAKTWLLQANREIFYQKLDTPVLSSKDHVIKGFQGMTVVH